MVARVERALNSSTQADTPAIVVMLVYGCAGLLVLIIGVLGLFDGSWPRKMMEAWINVHALFGLLLCALVLARCQWLIKRSPGMPPADFRELSRHLSHIVYLMLYAVVGVRLSIAILSSIRHGGAANFGLVDDPFRIGPDRAHLRPNADLQLFLVSGLLALVIVRVLAFKLWRSSVERATRIAGELAPNKPYQRVNVGSVTPGSTPAIRRP